MELHLKDSCKYQFIFFGLYISVAVCELCYRMKGEYCLLIHSTRRKEGIGGNNWRIKVITFYVVSLKPED